ncbi:Agamous-like MADS-box protein [Quillaja saponaria]|uniref:Agamous-like MADS-box protein n=1 Tax=Quillaja saponaria TaxID=32244 RepID=A0AAD7Q6I5_QUISA|nr:Agamous-like MADS-box protein [Quillaja saponaria]
MGRARLVMDLIRNAKARKTTYMKRKRGLVKKAFELNTLCGVDVCLLMHGPNTSSTDQPEIWPQDPNEVKRIINKYKAKTCNTPPKSYDLQDFFHDRKSKIEVEACKLRKEMLEIKYPAWDTRFDALSEQQLKKFITVLDKKIEACGQKLNEMKNNPNPKKTGASPSGVMINVEPTRSASCFNVMNSMPNVQMISTSMVKTPIHNQAMPLSPQIMLPFDSNKMQSGFLPHPQYGVLKPRSNNIQELPNLLLQWEHATNATVCGLSWSFAHSSISKFAASAISIAWI